MKYIRFRLDEANESDDEIVVFPKTFDHDVMAGVLEMTRASLYGPIQLVSRRPISAGFVDNHGKCHGRSETLNLDSKGELDTLILRLQGYGR